MVHHAVVATSLAAIVFLYYMRADCPAFFLDKDLKALERLWSDDDDGVITNPWNKFVTKQQVLGMVESGLLVITSYDRKSITSSMATGPLRPEARRVFCGGKTLNASKTPKSVSVCGRSQRWRHPQMCAVVPE
jgi:hypothetical protein